MTSNVGGGKRGPDHGDEQYEFQVKKRKRDDSSYLTNLVYHNDASIKYPNTVRLASDLFSDLFGRRVTSCYVKIGNFVFAAKGDRTLAKDEMNLHRLTRDAIWSSVIEFPRERVSISQFKPSVLNTGNLGRVRFRVQSSGTLIKSGRKKDPCILVTKELEKELRSQWNSPILTSDQEFLLKVPGVGPLKLIVEEWNLQERDVDLDFGKLKRETRVEFVSDQKRRLVLVEVVDPDTIQNVYLDVHRVKEVGGKVISSNRVLLKSGAWTRGVTPLPLPLSIGTISEKVRSMWDGVLLRTNSVAKAHFGGWAVTFKLNKVERFAGDDPMDIEDQPEQAFYLSSKNRLLFNQSKEVMYTKDPDEARIATEVTFEIERFKLQHSSVRNEVKWVSYQEIVEAIKQLERAIPMESRVVIEISGNKYLLKLRKAFSADPRVRPSRNLKDIWSFGDATKVHLYPNEKLNLTIVDTPKIYPLDSVKVVASTPPPADGGFLAMLMAKEEQNEKEVIPEEELKKAFLNALPFERFLAKDQEIKGMTNKGKAVTFKVSKFKSEELGSQIFDYGCLYQVHPETKIVLEGAKKGGVVVKRAVEAVSSSDIPKLLNEKGVGGMTKSCIELFNQSTLIRSEEFNEHFKKLGIRAPRGVLFWGPPGTGKTLLARFVGEMLGVPEDRVIFIAAPELLNKWVGGTEEKIRNLFKEAREAQETFGDQSPLFVYIFDEIDTFGNRDNAVRNWERTMVNQLIAEIDGGKDPLNNIFVIGITNRPDSLDPAL